MYSAPACVQAQIRQIDGFSAHADGDEILRWLGGFQKAPTTTFLVHGKANASLSISEEIRSRFGWRTAMPSLRQLAEL